MLRCAPVRCGLVGAPELVGRGAQACGRGVDGGGCAVAMWCGVVWSDAVWFATG